MIHPKIDWTPSEAKALEACLPESTYYFVLSGPLPRTPALQIESAHTTLEAARTARREILKGQIRVGSVAHVPGGTILVLL